jgi:IS4 transposase
MPTRNELDSLAANRVTEGGEFDVDDASGKGTTRFIADLQRDSGLSYRPEHWDETRLATRLLSHREGVGAATELIDWYRARWEIEMLFHVIKNACRVEPCSWARWHGWNGRWRYSWWCRGGLPA